MIIHKLSLGLREIPHKFGPDRFSRFDVYWIQTNKQTPKQTNKHPNRQIPRQAKFIYRPLNCEHVLFVYILKQNSQSAKVPPEIEIEYMFTLNLPQS